MVAQQRRFKQNHSKRELQTMSKRVARMEDEVYQTMVIMDTSTDNMLNFHQIRRDPKYKIQ